MITEELIWRCDGKTNNMIGNGFHKCWKCKNAIKARMIAHHIQFLFDDGYCEENFIELLELF